MSSSPTLTQLAKGTSTFLRFQDGKLYYAAEWWEDAEPFPIKHLFTFPIDVADAGGGEFLPFDKTLRFMRWAGQELRRLQYASTLQSNQCMGCQAGWPTLEVYPPRHRVEGGYEGELVACTRDRDGA